MPGLTGEQCSRLWCDKVDAEKRALYFGSIAAKASTVKRWISAGTFLLGSTSVVTALTHLPIWASWIPAAILTAANGYRIAVDQDATIKVATELHVGWQEIEQDYDRLWSHTFEDEAEARYARLQRRERRLSSLAVQRIGHRPRLWKKWVDFVDEKYKNESHEQNAHAATGSGEAQ